MAVRFLASEVSDLCLGKPALRPLPIFSTVADALFALRRSGENCVSFWKCDQSSLKKSCLCVGKVCMVDIICFLSREENLSCPSIAIHTPLSELIGKSSDLVKHLESHSRLVKHLESHSRLSEAIDFILKGAQNLVIPIENKSSKLRKKQLSSLISTPYNGQEFCWLTAEDVVRFVLNSIGVFSPVSASTIESLNIIDTDVMTIYYYEPASSAMESISRALNEQKSVAVLDEEKRIVGDISPNTLACCDETVAAAISTLSTGDLMVYIDYGGPPENLIKLVKMRLEEKKFKAMSELMEEISMNSSSSSGSSDEEFGLVRSRGFGRRSQRRSSKAIVCHPWSSLVAVMIQALAHRMSYVWVVKEDHSLLGIVTFSRILQVFRNFAVEGSRQKPKGDDLF